MNRKDFIRLSALSGCAMALSGCAMALSSCAMALPCVWAAGGMGSVPPFIVGSIADTARFELLNPHFRKAFEFLHDTDLRSLPDGKIEIDGDNVFAYVSSPVLTPFDKGGEAEAHREYIDIHAPICGEETIGTFTMTDKELDLPFNEKDDYVLFKARGEPVTLRPGEFIAFFPPYGAHRPGCTMAKVSPQGYRKICVKVKVEK